MIKVGTFQVTITQLIGLLVVNWNAALYCLAALLMPDINTMRSKPFILKTSVFI